jgi:hypothetical protein
MAQPPADSGQDMQAFVGYLARAHAAAWNPPAAWLQRESGIPQTTVETLVGGRRKRLPDWSEQVEPLLRALRRKVELDDRGDPDVVLGPLDAWKRAYDDAQNHRPLTCPLPGSSPHPPPPDGDLPPVVGTYKGIEIRSEKVLLEFLRMRRGEDFDE